MTDSKNKTGIIILAAGNSSRLGEPKQLLLYNETSLLKNTVEAAALLPNSVVIVVTGSNSKLIEEQLDLTQIKVSYNPDWPSGMSSSIVKGLNDLLLISPDIEKCIISVCDQPFTTHSVFENLLEHYHKSGKEIIASSYAETLGTPVLFARKYFTTILKLKGQEGAKKIISKFVDDTLAVPFEKGNIDIDTQEDYNRLISES